MQQKKIELFNEAREKVMDDIEAEAKQRQTRVEAKIDRDMEEEMKRRKKKVQARVEAMKRKMEDSVDMQIGEMKKKRL